MLEYIRFFASLVCTLAGLFCMISGVLGVYRFKYALSRIHAAALFDTVGIFLMLLGVIVGQGFTLASGKMIVVILFLWITSPVASHLIGRMEVTINDELDRDMTVADRDAVWEEKEGD